MKRIPSFKILVIILLFINPFIMTSQNKKPNGFYLKLNAEMSFSDAGDFKKIIDDNVILWDQLNVSPFRNVVFTPDSSFLGLGGEVGYSFGGFFLSAEVNKLSRGFDFSNNYFNPGSFSFDSFPKNWTETGKFSITSFLLNLGFKVLNTNSFTFDIFAGAGIFIGDYSQSTNLQYDLMQITEDRKLELQVEQNTFGVHFGSEIVFKLTKIFGFFAQAKYSFVDFKELKGIVLNEYKLNGSDRYDSFSGPLSLMEHKLLKYYSFDIYRESNSDNFLQQNAVFDLKGISLKAGVKIIFGGN